MTTKGQLFAESSILSWDTPSITTVSIELIALFSLNKSDRVMEEHKHFKGETFNIFQYSNVDELFTKHVSEFLDKEIQEFQERDSGWTLKSIDFLTINFYK